MSLDHEHLETALLGSLRRHAPRLRQLLDHVSSPKLYARLIYKFYSGSVKAYYLQESTGQIVAELSAIAPEATPLNPMFVAIVNAGTGHEFHAEVNEHWLERTAPIATAFLHAKFFLEMAVVCAASTADPRSSSGPASAWQAICSLYGV
jgi:hypothetical protein